MSEWVDGARRDDGIDDVVDGEEKTVGARSIVFGP